PLGLPGNNTVAIDRAGCHMISAKRGDDTNGVALGRRRHRRAQRTQKPGRREYRDQYLPCGVLLGYPMHRHAPFVRRLVAASRFRPPSSLECIQYLNPACPTAWTKSGKIARQHNDGATLQAAAAFPDRLLRSV